MIAQGTRSAFWSLLLALNLLTFPVYAAQTMQLVTTEFPPYTGKALPAQGIASEITVEALKRGGYNAVVTVQPWARALKAGKDGAVDGVVAIWHSKEREEWFVYSEPYLVNQVGFYKRADSSTRFNNLTDLKSYRIGTVRDYANPKAFIDAKLTNEEAVDDEMNLRKLDGKRLDLILVDKGVARYLIETKLPDAKEKLVWLDPPVEETPLYTAISKKAPDHEKKLAAFNLGLKQMKEDGTLAKMLSRIGQ